MRLTVALDLLRLCFITSMLYRVPTLLRLRLTVARDLLRPRLTAPATHRRPRLTALTLYSVRCLQLTLPTTYRRSQQTLSATVVRNIPSLAIVKIL